MARRSLPARGHDRSLPHPGRRRHGRLVAPLLSALTALALGTPSAHADDPPLVYQPPLLGAPASRVGGGTRQPTDDAPVLQVLAPDHVGLTTRPQPDLYWFVSGPARSRAQIVVLADKAIDPLFEADLEPVPSAGIRRLSLADQGVTLAPDVDYEWFITLVTDPARRSRDVVAGGAIRRVAPDPALATRVAAAPARERPALWAEAGVWYDAVAALGDLLDTGADETTVRAARASLLEQVGLDEAARFDRAPRR